MTEESEPRPHRSQPLCGPAVEVVACKMGLLPSRQGGLFSKDYELIDKDSVVCFMQQYAAPDDPPRRRSDSLNSLAVRSPVSRTARLTLRYRG